MRTPDESGDEETCYMQQKSLHHMSEVNQMSIITGIDVGLSDWKTDVAEFIPSSNGFAGQIHASGCDGTGCFVANGGCADFNFDSRLAATGTDGITSMWALAPGMTGVVAGGPQQAQWIVQVPLTGTAAAIVSGTAMDSKEAQQLRSEFEWQSRRQEEAQVALQERMDQLERQKSDSKEQWERERKAMIAEINSYRALLARYAVPLDEAKEFHAELGLMEEHPSASSQQPDEELLLQVQQQLPPLQDLSWEEPKQDLDTMNDSSLDAKLRRLGGLLNEDNFRKIHSISTERPQITSGEEGLGAKSIASTLQAMFPHATVRTQPNEKECVLDKSEKQFQKDDKDQGSRPLNAGLAKELERDGGSMSDAVVRRMAHGLEAVTGSEIDDRAMAALQTLPVRLALEALQKVDDLVQAQGGQCRNLSSILQSVCRKMERWSNDVDAAKRGRNNVDPKAELVILDSEIDDRDKGGKEQWNLSRIERVADRSVEIKTEGDRCRLRVSMASLDPPLMESGMKNFCTWFRSKLTIFKAKNGQHYLRNCNSEIDFSNNSLSNESVWMLLETLAQFEVQVGVLKLYKNRISSAGILALCEFIRNNHRAGPVYEMHLSHNEVDDESALELLRTLRESELKQRYPPRRSIEGVEGTHPVPVWVRLNQNKITEPSQVLRTIQAEGITWCAPRSADGCGPGQCTKKECPLLHLYLFMDQMVPRKLSNGLDVSESQANGSDNVARKRAGSK